MRSQLKAAFVVEAIVLIVALVFSVVYFVMGLYKSSRTLDVLLVIVWVLVGAVLLLAYRSRLRERDKLVRRFYLSRDWMYNHEIGYAPLSQIAPDRDPYEFVTFAAEALARMSYGFEVADAPSDFSPEYMITSSQFRFHFAGEGKSPDEKSVVIDRWKGALQRVVVGPDGARKAEPIDTYANAKQLAVLLGSNEILGGAREEAAPEGAWPEAGGADDLLSLLGSEYVSADDRDGDGLADLDDLFAGEGIVDEMLEEGKNG